MIVDPSNLNFRTETRLALSLEALEEACLKQFCHVRVTRFLSNVGDVVVLQFGGLDMLRSLCLTHGDITSGLRHFQAELGELTYKMSLYQPGQFAANAEESKRYEREFSFFSSRKEPLLNNILAAKFAMALMAKIIVRFSALETRPILVKSHHHVRRITNVHSNVVWNCEQFVNSMKLHNALKEDSNAKGR